MKSRNEIVLATVRRQFDHLGRKAGRERAKVSPGIPEQISSPVLATSQLANPKILDIGCGSGALLQHLTHDKSRTVAIDLSSAMLAAAKARCGARTVEFVQADGHDLPFASAMFDACNCSFCFANIRHPLRMLREMTRILRPGGLLLLTDVVAVGGREFGQVNRLERARGPIYTRILELGTFAALFRHLPLRWKSFLLMKRKVDFQQWITDSTVEPGTSAFRRARRVFRNAVLQQRRNTLHQDQNYRYSVAQFLLVRSN